MQVKYVSIIVDVKATYTALVLCLTVKYSWFVKGVHFLLAVDLHVIKPLANVDSAIGKVNSLS
jgi:hypothetical protein